MPDYSSFDLGEVIQEACEQAGIILRGPDQYKSARRSLALLLLEWSTLGIHLWGVKEATVPCVVSKADYGTADGLPTDFLDFIDASIRDSSGSVVQDTPLTRMGWAQYEALSNKALEGKPTRIMRVPGMIPVLRLWMVPDSVDLSIRMWYLASVANPSTPGRHAGDPASEVHVPSVFLPALCAGLALSMAAKSLNEAAAMRVGYLTGRYNEALTNAVEFSRDRSSLMIHPEIYM